MATPIHDYHRQAVVERMRRTSHRLWIILLVVLGIWSALILAVPIAAAAGAETGSQNLYSFFGYICHQMPSRSFYLVGHKFGVCSRCSGVYFGLLVGALLYPLLRNISETNPLPRKWLVLSMVPIAVDWSLTFFGIWENTYFTRFSTGLILGVACSVFIVPALAEIAQIMHSRHTDLPAESKGPA